MSTLSASFRNLNQIDKMDDYNQLETALYSGVPREQCSPVTREECSSVPRLDCVFSPNCKCVTLYIDNKF